MGRPWAVHNVRARCARAGYSFLTAQIAKDMVFWPANPPPDQRIKHLSCDERLADFWDPSDRGEGPRGGDLRLHVVRAGETDEDLQRTRRSRERS